MPAVIKKNMVQIKDTVAGEYISVDVIAERTTSEMIADIEDVADQKTEEVETAAAAAGAAQIAAIEDKGEEVLESIPEDYSDLSDDVDSLKSAFESLDSEVHDPVTGLDGKAPVIINTASGDIASFDDGADGMPIKSMAVQIEPVQDLHGYDNPWPGGGGKNLFDASAVPDENKYVLSGTGKTAAPSSGEWRYSDYIPVLASTAYYIGGCVFASASQAGMAFYDSENEYISGKSSTELSNASGVVTAPSNASYMRISFDITSEYNPNWATTVYVVKNSDTHAWSPYSNICPISGHTAVTVCRTGVNLWDEKWELGAYNTATGAPQSSTTGIRNKNAIHVKPGTAYSIVKPTTSQMYALFYGLNGNVVQYVKESVDTGAVYNASARFSKTGTTYIFTVPSGAVTMNLRIDDATTYGNSISINYPSTDTAYHPGHVATHPVTWQTEAGTVYGGSLTVNEDGTGTLVVDRECVTFIRSDNVSNSGSSASGATWMSIRKGLTSGHYGIRTPNAGDGLGAFSHGDWRYSAGDTWRAFIPTDTKYIQATVISEAYDLTTDSGRTAFWDWLEALGQDMQAVYPLATPLTYTLTAIEVLETLKGSNRIWADTGDVTVEYRADTKLYIEQLTKPTEDDMMANAAITSGKFFMIGNRLFLATAAIASGATIIPGTNCTELSLAEALNNINA